MSPPTDAAARATRLGRSMARWRALTADTTAIDGEIAVLFAGSDGQGLTTPPRVATRRAAAFAAFSLPMDRFPSAEHLYPVADRAHRQARTAAIVSSAATAAGSATTGAWRAVPEGGLWDT